jgi:hypothetical protein
LKDRWTRILGAAGGSIARERKETPSESFSLFFLSRPPTTKTGAAVASRQRREQEEEVGRKRAKRIKEGGESSESDSSAPSSPSSPCAAALSVLQRRPPLSPSSPTYWGCPVCRKPHALLPSTSSSEAGGEKGGGAVERFVEFFLFFVLRFFFRGGTRMTLTLCSPFFLPFHPSIKQKQRRSLSNRGAKSGSIAGFSLGLEVDPHLERLVLTLASSKRKKEQEAADPAPSSPFLLPPRDPERHPHHSHPLTVVLDLDGTLIASYPPSRAGALLAPRGDGGSSGHKPPAAFLVGQGSRLNPSGVLVLERPGLGEFLARLSEFAEVVLFTGELFCFPFDVSRERGRKDQKNTKELTFFSTKKKKKKPASRTTPAPSPRPLSPATGPLRCRRHRIGSIAAPRRPRARTLASKISRGWAGTQGRRFWSRTRRLRVWRSRTVWCP